jgi:hypothetical protein
MQEKVGAFRHFMLAQIGDEKLLTAQLMGPLYAGGQDRVALRCIAADDNYKAVLAAYVATAFLVCRNSRVFSPARSTKRLSPRFL